jgi:arylsulfatase A-like enzyme
MPERPNILWLMTDEQRADSMGYAGTPWAWTPRLDAVAQEGVRFLNAYTPSPVCIPARASLLTGRAASTNGVLNNHHHLDWDDPGFLTWRLAASGYQVASFGKHHYACQRQAFDIEGGQVLGDRVGYYDYRVPASDDAGVVRYPGERSQWLFAGRYPGGAEDTPEMANVREALAWMDRRAPSRPYLLRVSLNAPHTPVVTPAPFDTLIDPAEIQLPLPEAPAAFLSETHRDYLVDYAGAQRLSEDQVRRAWQCYYGQVAFVDHVFGELLDGLAQRGDLANTIIAYVSDHGTHLGEHGFFQKQSFWDVAAQVPCFLSGPGIVAAEVETPISTGSLLPTLLALAGVTLPASVEYPNLAPTLRERTPPAAEPVFSEIDYGLWGYRPGERYVMIRDGRWKLMTYRDPTDSASLINGPDRVLFDLVTDPEERTNLANKPEFQPIVSRLIATLDAWDATRPVRRPGLTPEAEDRLQTRVAAREAKGSG